MKCLSYYFIFWIFFIQSCSFNINDENQIYLVGRKFDFLVYYFDSDDSLQKIDSLELEVLDDFYPQRSQTAIKWTHYESSAGKVKIVKETTGVIDETESYFIHPPRKGDLHILSFADFPTISSFVFSDTTAESSSEGSIMMRKSHNGKMISEVKTNQVYKGKTAIDLPFKKNYRTHHLSAIAESELGSIYGDYYFSEEFGFVRMDYKLPDNTNISIRLSRVYF